MSKIITITATLFIAGGAQAQSVCTQRDTLLTSLATRWAESPAARGLINSELAIELYASPAGTWTLAIIGADGTACIAATGTSLEDVRKVVIPGVPG